jgi:hypothetical protein
MHQVAHRFSFDNHNFLDVYGVYNTVWITHLLLGFFIQLFSQQYSTNEMIKQNIFGFLTSSLLHFFTHFNVLIGLGLTFAAE